MLTTFTLIIVAVVAAIIIISAKSIARKRQDKAIMIGDIVMLDPHYKKDYPSIPTNNVLHILEVDDDFAKVEYIHFKKGSFHQEKLLKKVLRKVRRSAA
jgi:hypothetical protein